MSEAKSPLSRWSARKLAARRGEVDDEVVAKAPPVEPAPAEPTPPAQAEAQAETETPTLPSIDDLDFQSDYTVFLGKNVPEALRRAALRKLWVSDPILANLDGLNDYDEDYNLVDQAITLAQSGYQPGLGYRDDATNETEPGDAATEGTATPTDSPTATAEPERVASNDTVSDNEAAVEEAAAALPQPATEEADADRAEPAQDHGK